MVHAGIGCGRKGGNLIEYEDEDPAVSAMFETELKKAGIKNRMNL